MRKPLWVTRLLMIFVGLPIILALMIADALACAWDEFSADFRAAVSSFKDSWNGE